VADQGSEGLLSPFLRKQRLKAVSPFLRGKIFDVGCGSGALATYISNELYYGMDIDKQALALAQSRNPDHQFSDRWPDSGEQFDTVVALAVIEHVPEPAAFLNQIGSYLKPSTESRVIITTPHPWAEWIHTPGAKIGLFSKHASEEHETLLDHAGLQDTAKQAGFRLSLYRRFLFGLNQIAVMERLGN